MVRAAGPAALVAALLTLPAPASAAGTRGHGPPGFERAFTARAQHALDLGLRAYVLGSPLLEEQRVITNFPPNQLINVTRLSTPAQRLVVLPNVDTVYTVARLRLADGPLVLHVPPTGGRYFTMQLLDAYTNSFAYVGRRTTGSGATDVAIAGPRWRGRVPRGVRLVRSPTPVVWLLGRTLVDGPSDLPAVNALQRGYALRRLDALGGPPLASLSIPSSTLNPAPLPTGLAFFDAMGAAMAENPPPRRDRALLARLRRVGIGPGLRTSRRSLGAATRAGLRAAVAAGPSLLDAYAGRRQRASARSHRGWLLPPEGIGDRRADALLRASVARTALGANVRAEAVYPQADTDRRGRPLDGSHRYVLRFAPGQLPPVKAFWSLTMYGADRFLVENPIARYALGDRTAGLRRDAGGGLTILLQHDPPPAERQANWLPAPAGRFLLSLRLYEPRRSVLADRWPLPVITRTG